MYNTKVIHKWRKAMKETYLQLIELVRNVLKSNEQLDKDIFPNIDDIDMWKKIYDLAVAQEVQVFLYEATKNINIPDKAKNNFMSVHNRAVRKEAIMHLEVSKYFDELDKEKVTYLPIKGWNIKKLYDKPYLRTMTDVDVIIRDDGFDKACDIAKACGFHLEVEGENHHVFVKKPVTELEVHHQLFSKRSVLHQWGKDVLKKREDFTMSDEDTYIYLIAHMAKHFTGNGAGMRNVIDCYLANEHYKFDADKRSYIENELKGIELDVFEKRIRQLGKVWFDNLEYDDASITLTEYILDGGLYGKMGNSGAMDIGNKSTNKFKWVINEMFPDFEYLKISLGYKKMYKILTPVYWIIRLVRGLFRKDSITTRTTVIAKTEEDFENVRQVLDCVGLNKTNY